MYTLNKKGQNKNVVEIYQKSENMMESITYYNIDIFSICINHSNTDHPISQQT